MNAIIPKSHIVNIPELMINDIKNIPGDRIIVRENPSWYMIEVPAEGEPVFSEQGVIFDKQFFLDKVKLRLAIYEVGLYTNTVSTILEMEKFKIFTFQVPLEILRWGLLNQVKYFEFVSLIPVWHDGKMANINIHNVESTEENFVATFPVEWIARMGDSFWEKLYLETREKNGQNLAELIWMTKDRRYPEPPESLPPPKYTIEEITYALSLYKIRLNQTSLIENLELAKKHILLEDQLKWSIENSQDMSTFKKGSQ